MSDIKTVKPSKLIRKTYYATTGYNTCAYHIESEEETKLLRSVTLRGLVGEEPKTVLITNTDVQAILYIIETYGYKLTVKGGENQK